MTQLNRVSENSKERQDGRLHSTMQRNRGKHRWKTTRVLFRKVENIKGAFHPKMGTTEDRNSRDLVGVIEIKKIKKRWKEYMQ